MAASFRLSASVKAHSICTSSWPNIYTSFSKFPLEIIQGPCYEVNVLVCAVVVASAGPPRLIRCRGLLVRLFIVREGWGHRNWRQGMRDTDPVSSIQYPEFR